MHKTEQGDILKISGLAYPAVVVSNNFFNESGKAIVCPIVRDSIEGPLHIMLEDYPVDGFVLCEQVRYVDLAARRHSKTASLRYPDVLNISDAVMGIFDYQVFLC